MAMAGAQETSSSISRCTYQVFLSFRGKDTRKHFTAHLYKALVQAGIHTFRDDDELERGEDIQSELIKAIQQSRISTIVFSKDYASSRWCLDELLLILERKRTDKHVVFPIFYDVDPSQIRHQWGSVGESFARHEEKIKKETDYERKKELINNVKRWRAALKEIADLSGMELKNQANGDEAKFIQKVVNMIRVKLSHKALNVAPCLIGIDSRTININLWVQDESSDVGIMVICGMGGIGKTTIAKSVYNQNFERFAGSSFLSNIREMSEEHKGLNALQSQLLSDICKRNKEKIFNVDEGIVKIKEAICCKRVLIVLDDVDHVDQLYAILEMRDWLFPGSKIIVTTRHERLLKPYEVYKVGKVVYNKVEKLNHEESMALFSLHAFGQNHPPEIYTMYTKRIAEQCEGLPLALQILGSSLSGKNLEFWVCQLKKLETIVDNNIINKLKISFDSLKDDDIKNIFLHISCYFIGKEKNYVVKILDACDLNTVVGIDHLVDQCLLEIGYGNKLMMHQLIRDMGREIVRQESDEPGKRSRLWHRKDVLSVLQEKTGTKKVQALVFEMQNCVKDNSPPSTFGEKGSAKKRGSEVLDNPFEWFRSLKRRASNLLPWHPVEIFSTSSNEDLETNAFARMQRLKILKLSYIKLTGSYKEFPKNLRWLHWHGFPLASIPDDLSLENLVHLDMQYTGLRYVWKGVKFLPSLKILDLSHSKWLARTPNFRGAVNLERLILKRCVRLVEIDESIGLVERLSLLDLENCRILRKVPENVSSLRFLEKLEISGCSNLREFPIWMSDMESLKEIYAEGIGTVALFSLTREVPHWSLPRSLVELNLADCNLSDSSFPVDFSNLISLKELDLSMNLIWKLPDCVRTLSRLEELDLSYCPLLQSVVGLPSTVNYLFVRFSDSLERIASIPNLTLDSSRCDKLVEVEGGFKSVPLQNVDKRVTKNFGFFDFKFGEDIIDEIRVRYEFGIFSTIFPGIELPGLFHVRNRHSSSISCIIPSSPKNTRIRGLNVCFVYAYKQRDFVMLRPRSKLTNKTKDLTWRYTPIFSTLQKFDGDLIMLYHWKFGNLLEAGDEITFEIIDWYAQVKELGIKVVYDEDEDEKNDKEETNEMIMQHNNTPYLSWTEQNLFELSDFQDSGTVYNLNQGIHFGDFDDCKLVGWRGYK